MLNSATILDRLQAYLAAALKENLELSKLAKDGRVNSQENERQISQALEYFALSNEWFKAKQLALEVAPARHWYDFAVRGANDFFRPVNVKVSALRTSDNLSSKEGLFYALTGIAPEGQKINNWESFCERLANNLGTKPEADYYFMVISKHPPHDVFWTSLKQIRQLVPNGKNPPFQCHWGQNRQRIVRTSDEAQKYVLGILQKTFQLRAAAHKSFDNHLALYV